MIPELITFGIFILAAVTGGFFMGIYQVKGETPDINPLPAIKETFEDILPEKKPNYTMAEKKELDKVNTFYGEREL